MFDTIVMANLVRAEMLKMFIVINVLTDHFRYPSFTVKISHNFIVGVLRSEPFDD